MAISARLLATSTMLALAVCSLTGCQREAHGARQAEARLTAEAPAAAEAPAPPPPAAVAPPPVPPLPVPSPAPSPALIVPVRATPSASPNEPAREIAIDAPAALPTLSLSTPHPSPAPAASQAPAPTSPATSGAGPKPVAEKRFAPRNDCASLPGWSAFHERLAKAVAEKDADAFARLARPEVKLDYGGGSGRAELRKRLSDRRRGLWSQLSRIMPLGCAVADGIVAMPWYFWNLPTGIDPYDTMLVTGEAVPLRAKPDADARTLATLDWPMVAVPGGKFDSTAKYTPVRTRAGKQDGYVLTAKLRSVLDYRLIAERRDGTWQITAFVTGD
ncbi:hypothetical protein RXV95_04890 [Novosphingobium sp. ZN18A2]|uniref:hypothetical protein n=1 Tax=Novosphingobium sp. ZN18A2 TaxID=3079861 RepID=UPI0030D28A41